MVLRIRFIICVCLLTLARVEARSTAAPTTELPAPLQTTSTKPEISSRQLDIPLIGMQNDEPSMSLQENVNMVKTIGQTLTAVASVGSQKPLGSLLDSIIPQASTEVAKKEDVSQPMGPIESLGKNIDKFGSDIVGGNKVLEAPMRVFNSLLSAATNISKGNTEKLSEATETVVKATEGTSKVVTSLVAPKRTKNRKRKSKKQEQDEDDEDDIDESEYYEYSETHEPYAHRRPKYFSRECPFRFACEVGKIMKPLAEKFTKEVEKNRFLQDLQNRYTRAMTYGSLRGDCNRYYCFIVALLGGPQGFASGVSEMVNRIVNPDTYEVVDGLRRR